MMGIYTLMLTFRNVMDFPFLSIGWLFKTLLMLAVASVDDIGVVPWCFIWCFIWLFLHTIYKKFFRLLLKRCPIPRNVAEELVKLYWKVPFNFITIPFALQNLNLPYTCVIDKLYFVLDNPISVWFIQDPSLPIHIKFSYVMLSGYYLHNTCEICLKKGMSNFQFIMNELLTLFFISTYPLRCIQFGLVVITAINVVDFVLSISKLVTCFSGITDAKNFKYFIYFSRLIYYIVWTIVYLNLIPRYLLLGSLKKMLEFIDAKYLPVYVLLNGSILLFYILVLMQSATDVVTIIRKGSLNLKTVLERYLIGSDEANNEKEMEKMRIAKKKENLLKMYQTVKCSIIIKRKLKKIRSRLEERCVDACNYNEDMVDDFVFIPDLYYSEDMEDSVER